MTFKLIFDRGTGDATVWLASAETAAEAEEAVRVAGESRQAEVVEELPGVRLTDDLAAVLVY